MSTRREVAKRAGVSVRTVSNVVAGYPPVAPATKLRVLSAIAELDYRPSEIARTLRMGRSGLIGLMLPELDTPYFADLTRAVVDAGHRRGFTVVVDQTDGDIQRERALVARAARGGIFDALLLSPLALEVDDIVMHAGEAPAVLLGEVDYPGHDKVMIDNAAAAATAVTHLIDQGARRIAAVGRRAGDRGTATQRLDGWARTLREHDLPPLPELAPAIPAFSRSAGYEAMQRLLDLAQPPDGVFAFSDPLAHGAMRALHERGVKIPDDIVIVGIDDNEESAFSTPTLSSVAPDLEWIAEAAFDMIARRLAEPTLKARTMIAPFHLEVRESSSRG